MTIVCDLILIASFATAEPKVLSPALVISATTTAAAMADRRFIFTLSRGHVDVWNALSGQMIADVPGSAAAVDNRSEMALVGSELWDLHDGKRLEALEGGNIAGFTPDGHFAITGRDEIQIWNLKLHAVVGRISAAHPRFIAMSDNGNYIALGRGAQFDVYDMRTGSFVRSDALAGVWPFRNKPSKGFSDFIFQRATEFSVVYEQAGDPRLPEEAQPLYQVDWDSRKVNMFAKSHVSERGLIARVSGNDVVVSLSADPAAEQLRLVGHRAPVKEIAFSPDHWTVATGDTAGEVRLWDVFNGEQLSQLTVDGGAIASLDFSPDAQFLLAATHSQMRVYAVSP